MALVKLVSFFHSQPQKCCRAKCPPTTHQLLSNTSILLEWLKPNMSHFKHLQVILPLMYVCICVEVCTPVYVSESQKYLLLPWQVDYDDSSLTMKRNSHLCFLHHLSCAYMRVCVCKRVYLLVCVSWWCLCGCTKAFLCEIRQIFFVVNSGNKSQKNKWHERFETSLLAFHVLPLPLQWENASCFLGILLYSSTSEDFRGKILYYLYNKAKKLV